MQIQEMLTFSEMGRYAPNAGGDLTPEKMIKATRRLISRLEKVLPEITSEFLSAPTGQTLSIVRMERIVNSEVKNGQCHNNSGQHPEPALSSVEG